MLFDLKHRNSRPATYDTGIETRPRVEVCPPSLNTPQGIGRFNAWVRRHLGAPAPFSSTTPNDAESAKARALNGARADFLRELADIRNRDGHQLRCIIADCQSLRELWHLRSKVFGLVAVHFSQHEADTRLERLNRHFPTRSPRSGLAPFDAFAALDRE